jgi:anion-transporting  ArsA/GET3 family ATPase
MRRRLHFVTGKGGVGKSTVSAALALAAARREARVLAIELGEPAGLTRILAGSGIVVATFDGADALAEYLTIHLGRIARPVVDHPLYAAFVGAAPGLRELMAVGKIRDEFALHDRWDTVVVDAGATGHALEHLRMPAATSEAFASGRVHREAAANAALLRDRARCSIHVVATPEHMALREAAQLIGALRELDLATGALFVNRCLPPAPPGVDTLLARVAEPAIAGVLQRARERETRQQRGIAAVEAELFISALRLPQLREPDGRAQAAALAPCMAEVA